jgi:hypothetical protein
MVPIMVEARADSTRYRADFGFVPKVAGPMSPFADKRQEQLRGEVEAAAPGHHRQEGTHAPRVGSNAWSIEAARNYDLRGKSYIEITKGLEYHDWEFAHPRRSKGAERRVRDGRRVLQGLGAWPWALAANGVLPARWWEQERFTRALTFWWRDAMLNCLQDVFRTAEIASSDAGSDDRSVMANSVPSGEQATRILVDWCSSLDQSDSEAA